MICDLVQQYHLEMWWGKPVVWDFPKKLSLVSQHVECPLRTNAPEFVQTYSYNV